MDGVLVRPAESTFQVPQPAHTQLGPLGELLLRQLRRGAVLPEQLTESGPADQLPSSVATMFASAGAH